MKSPIQRQLEIFSAALERPVGPERDAYLAQTCAGDDALRQCVDALLASHTGAGSFLGQPAGPVCPTGTHLLPATEKPGDKIGRYKLLQQIGEGGCGTVYMAEQEEPIRRRVALKVIRLGMDTKSVVARFEAERQALALMDHPNIAKVFDGGATENGRPYFVMELVRGIKITDYCDQAQLSTTERLKLFTQVCQAVQHAHQKGIIHRDIKPSNILVTVNDGVAVPKVIDFGIAKATDQRLTDKTYFTQFQAFIGTPAYTSPEQAEMSSLDIDTRSDIYSLGVLLYELLTGQTPFPAERLLQSGLDEMRRIIREEEPPRPSTRLTTLGLADATELSRKRQAKIPQLANAVEGDLDWIVMKALEKDRGRRYATSLDFAADLQRHLSNEAVLARPPSLAYKFQRTVRRNKGAFAAATAVVLTLLAGLGLTAWQAVRAKNAEQSARLAEHTARTDRDRAVLAESNATVEATRATNALQTANERMVKLNVAEGWRRVEDGDYFGALLPFAEAFALEKDNPDRAQIHQMRLASVLQRSPRLVNVWSVGTNIQIDKANFSKDGTRLIACWRSLTGRFKVASAVILDSETGRVMLDPSQPTESRYPDYIAWSGDEKRVVAVSHRRVSVTDDDGRTVAAMRAGDRRIQVWDVASSQPVGSTFSPADNTYSRQIDAVLNFDGSKLLVCDPPRLLVTDVMTGTSLWERKISHPNPNFEYHATTWSPDGRHLVCEEGVIEAQTGRSVTAPTNVHFAEFSADSARLFLVGDSVGMNHTWAELRDGNAVGQVISKWSREATPYRGRFSQDGRRLATANSDATVRVWNALDGSPATSPMEHAGPVADVCFSSDGAWLATGTGYAAEEGYAQVWDAATGKAITPRLPHDGNILRVAFSKNNTQLFVVGEDGTVAVWSLAGFNAPRFTWSIPGLGVDHLTAYAGSGRALLSPDGKVLLSRSSNPAQRATTWSLESGDLRLPPLLKDGWSWTPIDSSRLLASVPDRCSVLDLRDGSLASRNVAAHLKRPNTDAVWADQSFIRRGWAPAANGRWIAVHQDGGDEIVLVDALTGSVTARLNRLGLTNQLLSVLVRQDGQQILAAVGAKEIGHKGQKTVVCWNVGRSDEPEMMRTDGWYPTDYSRSGKLVVFQHENQSGLKVFETETFREVLGNEWIIDQSSFDDRWMLASHSYYERWQIHSATNPSLKSPMLTHRSSINCGDFTSDNRVAITAGADLKLRFWSVPIAEPTLLPLSLPSEAMEMEATSDGRGFITVHADDTIRFWELPKSNRSASDWLALGRFFAKGRGTDPGGTGDSPVLVGDPPTSPSGAALHPSASPATTNASTEPPGPQSFRDEWLALRAKHPEDFTVSADEIDAWHRHEAWRCESTKDWSNAIAHLSALLETHPDSGDFLPRRAAAYVAMANELVASGVSRITSPADATQPIGQSRLTSAATNYLERALADLNQTLAWVDRYPAIARESRLPFVEKRREVYLKLDRKTDAAADERELKTSGK